MSRRVSVNRPMVCSVADSTAAATCLDISGGGCALRTRETIPVGTEVRVRIDLPRVGAFTATAEVVRVREVSGQEELGLRITSLDERNLRRLHSYLAESARIVTREG